MVHEGQPLLAASTSSSDFTYLDPGVCDVQEGVNLMCYRRSDPAAFHIPYSDLGGPSLLTIGLVRYLSRDPVNISLGGFFKSAVPKITLHCVRHAQGFHNLNEENNQWRDPPLTPLGESQCRILEESFPYHGKITHLVASPLTRTVETCLLGFAGEVKGGKKIVALPELQETSTMPCDTGLDPSDLRDRALTGRWKGVVDFSHVHDGWNDKSPNSRWAPEADKLEERARDARRWLRNLGLRFGEDAEIVVVTHGGYLHFLTEDWVAHDRFPGTGWANTEFRSYTFESEVDDGARMVETPESQERRRDSQIPLTRTEIRELQEVNFRS